MTRSPLKQGAGPPLLLLATNAVLAYSTARCLQDAGHRFRLLSRGRYSATRISRWCCGGKRFLQSSLADDTLARQVAEELSIHGLACVVPAGIEATLYLAHHRDLFAPERLFPLSPRPLLDQLNDKWSFYNLLVSLGMPQPKTYLVESREDLEQVNLTPPVVVKPLVAEGGQGVTLERDARALRSRIELAAATKLLPLLVQELIPGIDEGASALADNGSVLSCRVQRGALGGQSPLEYTQEQDAAEALTTLVEATGFHGVLNLDYRRDERDGSLQVLECNPRLFSSAGMAAWTGVNMVEQGLALAAQAPHGSTGSSSGSSNGSSSGSQTAGAPSELVSTTVLSLPAALRAFLTRQSMSAASRHKLSASAADPLSTVVHLVECRLIRRWPKLAARIFDEPLPVWGVAPGSAADTAQVRTRPGHR